MCNGNSMAFPLPGERRQQESCWESPEKPKGWFILKMKPKYSFLLGCCCPREGAWSLGRKEVAMVSQCC